MWQNFLFFFYCTTNLASLSPSLVQGHSIVVYDVSEEAMRRLEDEGACTAANPSEVASKVDRIISMLPNSQHVRSCYAGDKGVFQLVDENCNTSCNIRDLSIYFFHVRQVVTMNYTVYI